MFQKELTWQPDLELLKNKMEFAPDEDTLDGMVMSVPFVHGSENVGKEWIKEVFGRLLDIYRKEIKKYDGSVALYLADKSQKLKATAS
ncbi:MAG: hypothetical protein K6G24_11325 [Lachnospiraceae bacterium]|nr:hypothetical protein [Lachnospiraceae bacterium]